MGKHLVVVGLLIILVGAGCADQDPLGPCVPTGRTLTLEGVTFVEIGPGSFYVG